MPMPAFLRRLRARIKYRHVSRDLAEELDTHRAMAEEAARAHGASSTEARHQAALALGNTTRAREDARAAWFPAILQDALKDAAYAARGMRRSPGFSLAAVVMLTIGIGLVAGSYTVFNGLFLRGWQVPDSGAVFRAAATRVEAPTSGSITDGFSYDAFTHLRDHAAEADYVAYQIDYVRVGATADGDPAYSAGMAVSAEFIETLDIPLYRGAGFSTAPKTSLPRAAISHRIWNRVLTADPNVLGRTVWINRQPATVVAVMAPGFDGLGERVLDVLVELDGPLSRYVERTQAPATACCITLAGRLRPESTRDGAQSELAALVSGYRETTNQPPLRVAIGGTAPGASLVGNPEILLALSLIGVGCLLVLLLTCANVGNLYLARCLRRRHEIAVRLSIGASRARVVRQMLAEGSVLAAIAGGGALLVTAAVPHLMDAIDDGQPLSMLAPDWRVAAFSAIAAMATALVVSLAPALQSTRVIWRGTTGTTSVRTGWLRGAVLAVQIAIATVLVLGATLVARGVQHSLITPPDFARNETVAVELTARADRSRDSGDATRIRNTLATLIRDGRLNVGLADRVPASNRASYSTATRQAGSEVNIRTSLVPLSASGADVLDLQLVSGRWASDDPQAFEAVVNETLARRLWADTSALGQTLELQFNSRRYQVVGVTRDAHLTGLDEVDAILHVAPLIGLPVLLARSAPETEPQIRTLMAAVDPTLTLTFTSLSDSIRSTLQGAMIGAAIAGGLGLVALVLAVVGIFGVFSYLVEERRREIGIRLALGASRRQVIAAMLTSTRWAVGAGLVGGFVLSLLVAFGLREFLFGLSPIDPPSYLTVSAILVVAAVVATAIPVRRALRVDPAVTLKTE
jgi:predicted permease